MVVMAGGFLGGLRAERFSKRGAAWEASSGRRDLEAPSLDSDLTATAATASQTMVAMVVSAREPG